MKKHRLFAALTAAVVAISSALVFPSAAFAEEVKHKSYSFDPEFSESVELDENDKQVNYNFLFSDNGRECLEGAGIDLDKVEWAKATTISMEFEVECEVDISLTVHAEGLDNNENPVKYGFGNQDPDKQPLNYGNLKSGMISTDGGQLGELTDIKQWNGFEINAIAKGEGNLTLKVSKVIVEFDFVEREDEPEGKLTYDLTESVQWMTGARSVNQDSSGRYYCGATQGINPNDMPWQLEGIDTLGDFFEKYNDLMMRFGAFDIEGSLQAVGKITTIDGKVITLNAQHVREGQNIYHVSFEDVTYDPADKIKDVSVSICSRTSSISSFVFAEYDSELLTATGTQTLTKDFKPESDITVTVNKEQGPPPPDVVAIWGNGPNDEYSTEFPVSDITELYANYKGGEITFYVKDLDANGSIVYDVILNPYATLSSNNTLRGGKNTVKFDLPKISYTDTNLEDIILRFHADPGNTAEFKLSSSASSDSTSSNTDEIFDKENEVSESVESSPDAAGVPAGDKITSITINPAFNLKNKDGDNVELDLSKIKIKAKEIYDEESLARVEAALGKEIAGNKHYNLLDLTLLYNGEDFSNGYEGLVQVIIPLPTGHRDKTFSCYRMTEVNGKMVKEEIPGKQTEDSYIIYLEHFSLYALVADGGETTANNNPGKGTSSTKVADGGETTANNNPGKGTSSTKVADGGKTTANNNNPVTGTAGAGVAVALAAMSAAALIVCRKKKHD